MLTLFAGAGLLIASLMVGLWLPRRRLSLTLDGQRLRLGVRGERFDDLGADAARSRDIVARILGAETGTAQR